MDILLMLITFLTPIITALTTIFKGYVPTKFYALIPIIVGLILGALAFPILPLIGVSSLSIGASIWAGLLSGLSASGFYSAQNIRKK
ncbi:Phage holin [compost metagenome]